MDNSSINQLFLHLVETRKVGNKFTKTSQVSYCKININIYRHDVICTVLSNKTINLEKKNNLESAPPE